MDRSDSESDYTNRESDASDAITQDSNLQIPIDPSNSSQADRDESASLGIEPGTWVHRYRIEERLGRGGFGVVYRAFDSKLVRSVAIKVAINPICLQSREEALNLLDEARAAAKLDHPNLVRVFDIDEWNNHTFVVMELVEGRSLSKELKPQGLMPLDRVLMICKGIVAAMVHLHENRIVHRDLKPSNILIAEDDQIKVADLGLALTDESPGWFRRRISGTRRYMAPEQILGEVHRIDGRTDIWGFGIILFEMLTSVSPFRQIKDVELFQAILRGDFESPRVHRQDIPEAIELLCLKCLSPRMVARFQDAKELEHAIEQVEIELTPMFDAIADESLRDKGSNSNEWHSQDSGLGQDSGIGSLSRNSQPSRSHIHEAQFLPYVVPRGLRPFDGRDSEYYMRLMPGPYDIQGIPAIVSTWQAWAENLNSDAQPVGVIYGPSGCGKSSFALAALIPSVNRTVRPVYCNLTVQDPVAGILASLHEELEYTQPFASLQEALAAIQKRKSHYKILLVLDQFEQYLVGHPVDIAHPIVQALRQCDGKHIQALLLVRNEFWSEIGELMQMLEYPLSDESNASGLPLLNLQHAQRVLASFGRAYETIPTGPLSDTHRAFIEKSVKSLAQENQILCVHLSIFAELMRNHSWDIPTLNRLGGADGILLRFLSDAFDSPNASPLLRANADACADILRELIPDDDRELKTSAQSLSTLAASVSDSHSSNRFQLAMRCLDQELHLLTKHQVTGSDESYYSLSHDYLVQPIKNWLMVRDAETWRGLVRNRLVQAAMRLKRDPKTKQLLTPAEWLAAHYAVPKPQRSELQHRVMSRSGSRAQRWAGLVALLTLGLISLSLWIFDILNDIEGERRRRAESNATTFVDANPGSLEEIWKNLSRHSKFESSLIKVLVSSDFDRANMKPRQESRYNLLLELAGLNLDAGEVLNCLSVSDEEEFRLWGVALATQRTRDDLVEEISANPDSESLDGFRGLQWHFMRHNDFRLRPSFSEVADPMTLVYELLAVADGASEAELASTADLLWRNNSECTQQNLYQKIFAIHLLCLMEQPYPLGNDMSRFLIARKNSTDRAVALSCQTLLDRLEDRQLEDKRVVEAPNQENNNWSLEQPVSKHPFIMIRIPTNHMSYQRLELQADKKIASIQKDVVIGDNVWLAREEVSTGLYGKYEMDTKGELEYAQEVGSTDIPISDAEVTDVLKFCNWLSKQGDLDEPYVFYENGEKVPDGYSPFKSVRGVAWRQDAKGYRLPSFAELQLASVHGDPEEYWSMIGNHPKFQGRLAKPQSRKNREPSWTFFPNAWGFTGLMGNLGDMNVNDQLQFTILPPTITNKESWKRPIINPVDGHWVASIRLARGPHVMQTTETVTDETNLPTKAKH
jgi:serine/threonine protein kinase